jgi:uncharacterized membrane-anchored protein YhcB (DUF1043 family)
MPELTPADIIAVAGIVATIIVGIIIIYMQKRADRRINEIIHHKDDLKKSIKRLVFVLR